jgi:hypothetical protein
MGRQKKGPSGYFGWVPTRLAEDRTLSKGALRLFVLLASYANAARWAWPSQGTLADRLGAHRRSVRSWLEELEEAGFIRRWPFIRESGGKGSDWILVAPLPDGVTGPPTPMARIERLRKVEEEHESAPGDGAIVTPGGGAAIAPGTELLNGITEHFLNNTAANVVRGGVVGTAEVLQGRDQRRGEEEARAYCHVCQVVALDKRGACPHCGRSTAVAHA